MAKRFIDAEKLIEHLEDNVRECGNPDVATEPITYGCSLGLKGALSYARTLPTADVVEVADVSEQIIRKKAEIIDYWKNNVKQYRAMQGYCDIEHDTDNFLRGYNEAVEDVLAILDGARKDGDEDDL